MIGWIRHGLKCLFLIQLFFRRFYYENYHYKPSVWKWRPGVTLFHIGLATPASSLVQIILCGAYFRIIMNKKKAVDEIKDELTNL